MSTIAFCGLGLMGSQMAARLRGAGHSMRVWNRSPRKAESWVAEGGGMAAGSPAEAAAGAAELHLMLADDAAVEAVLFGQDGALSGPATGLVVVDHSTVSIAGAAERAARVKGSGRAYLHAPVLAGPSGVARGEGLMMVGGAQATYDAASPVLSQILSNHWYVGASERDAAAFKLMANSLLLNLTEALSECFDLARSAGIDRARAMELFGHFDPSKTFSMRGPRMAQRDYGPLFFVSMAAKDAKLMLDAARSGGTDMPSIGVVHEKLLRLMREGHGGLDLGALALDESPEAKQS
jgi:3-hydroxyisobutyrate dehydrogenase-like beta-hydroxyacid dehydrogenase